MPRTFGSCWPDAARSRSCSGVRENPDTHSPDNATVVASDAVLFGELLNGVSTLGGAAKHHGPAEDEEARSQAVPMPERIQQSLVWSPGQVSLEDARARATEVFESFRQCPRRSRHGLHRQREKQSGRGTLCSQTRLAARRLSPKTMSMTCRPDRAPSSFAIATAIRNRTERRPGLRLSKNEDAPEPGFYYEKDDGTWAYAGGKDKDTALVFYLFREALGRLDMVLSGFSGRATRLLAKTLAIRGEEFWPPVFEEGGLQIGAYLVQYDNADTEAEPR